MPGSGAVYGDALTAPLLPKNWEKPLTELEQRHYLVCAITPCANRAENFGTISSAVFFAFAQRPRRMQVIGNH